MSWRREEDQSLCRRQNRDRCTYHDFHSADGCSRRCTILEEKKSGSGSGTFAAAVKDVHVPDIGSDEVEVTSDGEKVGDTVEAEQSLITVEGDKASMEMPAPFAGAGGSK